MPDENLVEGKETQEAKEAEVETPEGFIALDQHQREVNKQHRKFRDEERGRTKEKDRADGLQKENEALKATDAAVEIPPVPDRYSESYETDLQTRDDAIKKKAAQDAEQTRLEDQQKRDDEARIATESQALDDKVAAFDKKMVDHGLNPAETKTAADAVIGYGISNSFQDVLLEDPDGPLLVMYLSQNPIELETMNGMSTLQLVNHINGDVRAKASLLKPHTSDAPNPPIIPRGGGVPEQIEEWEKGARYE